MEGSVRRDVVSRVDLCLPAPLSPDGMGCGGELREPSFSLPGRKEGARIHDPNLVIVAHREEMFIARHEPLDPGRPGIRQDLVVFGISCHDFKPGRTETTGGQGARISTGTSWMRSSR
jgi:hypothetical protein